MYSPWEMEWLFDAYTVYPRSLEPTLVSYKRRKLIGRNVMDIGCGKVPLSNCLSKLHKRVLIDVVDRVHELSFMQDRPIVASVDLNALVLGDKKENEKYSSAISRLPEGNVHALVASNIINYLDYKNVIMRLDQDIAKGGLVFVCNGVDFGSDGYFHPNRPKNTLEIVHFMESKLNYETRETRKGMMTTITVFKKL